MNRKADPIATDAMQPLETLPVFYPLEGKRVLVIGGGEGAAWKADLVAATGARVEIFTSSPCARVKEIAETRANVSLHLRSVQVEDFTSAILAFGATFDDEEADHVRKIADEVGVPLNLADRPQMSDFIMGAIVNRSPLVIGVSTGGASPVFAQAVRGRIETLVPASFAAWARAAQAWRPQILLSGLDFVGRREFWRRFTRLAFQDIETKPTDVHREDLLAQTQSAGQAITQGRVTLVGAGPGDPELITLKGMRALAGADVVLFDDLVPASILDFARREATRINVGKRGYAPSVPQKEITALLVSLAQEGKHVVRLKGGDPMIFGRANEEITAMRRAGLEIEVIPGVTAACAGAAAIGASLTSRETARRVQFITAHSKDGDFPEDFEWRALADPRATTAVYMGHRTLPALSARLLKEGLPAETPAYLIERASSPEEKVFKGTIADLPQRIAEQNLSGPVMLLIGRALSEE